MIRKAFGMSVIPGCEQDYENRHRPIWPELENALQAQGVHNYSVFLDTSTRLLFAYAESGTKPAGPASRQLREGPFT